MRFALAVAALLIAAPASAKDITITLNDEEQRGLVQLIDAAVKAVGLQGAEAGVYLHRKIMAAQAAAVNAPSPAAPEPKK